MHLSSHILLGKRLLQESALQGRPLHRLAFLFGSIRPDILGSFIIKKHTPARRYANVLFQIEKSFRDAESGKKYTFVSSIRLGVICHFLADFFCYPHNEGFKDGSVIHYRYEAELYRHIRDAVCAPDHAPIADSAAAASTVAQLHGQYVSGIGENLSRDAFYIVTVCSYIFRCIQLANVHAGGDAPDFRRVYRYRESGSL